MAKKLSEQLAELSVRAKNIENEMAAAETEARGKIAARREAARATATAAVEKVGQEIKTIKDNTTASWSAARTKVDADMDALKAKVSRVKHDLDVKQATTHADLLEDEAAFAVDYAIASVEQANLAVLDAIEARLQAEEAGTA